LTLGPGTKLGPYEIQSPLGAGGMGEVYRARDSKLNRDVALKVLPDSFANDPDRLARFQREAQVLASLHHSNIAAIYGLEECGSGGIWDWSSAGCPKHPTSLYRLSANCQPRVKIWLRGRDLNPRPLGYAP
jgi:serine/threonine protein kinase